MGQGPEALLPLMLLEAQDCPEEHRGESAGGGQDGGGGSLEVSEQQPSRKREESVRMTYPWMHVHEHRLYN